MLKKKHISYQHWLLEWLEFKKKFIKESSYATYVGLSHLHIIPTLGKYKLNELTTKLLQEFIIEKCNSNLEKPLSEKTVKDIMTIVCSSINAAVAENKMHSINLTFTFPKKNIKRNIDIFEKDEQKKLIKYCHKNLNSRNIGILLALYTGLRIGELSALQWKHINLKKNIISIEQTLQRIPTNGAESKTKIIITQPKTLNSIREIPISRQFSTILKDFQTDEESYLLSGNEFYIEPRTYRRYYQKILQKNNLKQLKFHCLRHSFATTCIDLKIAPKIVSELLGHSSIQTTLNLYVHPTLKDKAKCIDVLYNSFSK